MVSEKVRPSGRSLASAAATVLAFTMLTPAASAQTYLYGQADLGTGNGAGSVVAADFNGDGRPDLAVANNSDNTISVILGQPDGTFSAKTDFPTGTSPSGIIVADFNGDGKLDLATFSYYQNIISVLLGNGDGTFQNHVDYATGGPTNIVAADFNGDGKIDLAAINGGGGTLSLFIGNGDGTFQPPTLIPTPSAVQWGTTGDFNGDGKPDLVLSEGFGSPNEIIVLLNNGDATFTQVATPTPYSGGAIAVGDFNGDGKLDIAVGGDVLLGNGNGTFQTPGTPLPQAGGEESFILAADVNNDGKLDLITSGFLVFLGNGDGTFQNPLISYAPSSLVYPPPTQFPAVADFNGDGFLDLVTTHINLAFVLLGNGNGTFASQSTVALPSSQNVGPSLVDDFNGDGKPDLAVVQDNNGVSGLLSVLLGNGNGTFQKAVSSPLGGESAYAAASGDFNGDGKADVALLGFDDSNDTEILVLFGNGDGSFQAAVTSTLPSGWVPQTLAAGDFNGDGKADLAVTAENPSNGANSLYILIGNGNGTFQVNSEGSINVFGVSSVIAADFRSDGKLDLIVTTQTGFSIYLGNGDGTFASPVAYSTGAFPFNMAPVAGDFNGDGKLDVAGPSSESQSMDAVVLLGNGDGTFQPPLTSTLENSAEGIGFATPAADFNGDGKLDLLVTGGNGTGPALGNGDGTFGPTLPFSSPLPFSIFGAGSAIGDFNSDGVADVASPTPAPFQSLQSPFVSLVLSTPTVALYPSAIDFAAQAVGTSSAAQSVSLANAGNSSLALTSVTTTGDFSETNTCGSELAIQANCTIDVTFTPTESGGRTGTLTLTDDLVTSPQTLSLSGTGTGPTASLSPTSLPAFSSQNVDTSSKPQTLTLTNSGNADLVITGMAISGTDGPDFSQTNTCASSVAAGVSCTINVTFKPNSAGLRTATLTVTDNSNGEAGSTQAAILTGTGTAPEVSLTPASVSFGGENVGTASSASTVTLTNNGNASLAISGLAISGSAGKDFAIEPSSTCSTKTAVAAGKNCAVSLLFTPSAAGTRSATLTITDNANDARAGTQTVALSGTGKSFSLSPASGSPSSATVSPGASANYTLALSPQSGFDETVQVTCTEPAALTESACTPSPVSLTLSGSSAASVMVTITTTAASLTPMAKRFKPPAGPKSALPGSATLWALAALGLLALLGFARKRRAYGLAVTALLVLLWGSCGGGGGSTSVNGNPGTPAGTYNIVVSVAGGNVTQSATLSLTVQ
jgi:hypothetical protein